MFPMDKINTVRFSKCQYFRIYIEFDTNDADLGVAILTEFRIRLCRQSGVHHIFCNIRAIDGYKYDK